MNRVEIKGKNARATVSVDGVDVRATGLRLDMDARSIPELTLYLPVVNDTVSVDTDAVVMLDEATHQALIAMGWTPPTTSGKQE